MSTRPVKPLLSVVMPCFNEEAVLAQTHQALVESVEGRDDLTLELIYIDDGSADRTPRILAELARADQRVTVVKLSRNFGHQPAVSAGLLHARGDCIAVMDADLQDPPEVMLQMVERWRDGADVVYGVRRNREGTGVNKALYHSFYRILRLMADIDIPVDSGDFCLMDRRVASTINALPERGRFMRGLRAWSGYRQEGLEYDRPKRAAGETKYSYAKLLRLGLDGIFDFSTKPLTIMFWTGLLITLLSFAGICFYLLAFFFDWNLLRSSGAGLSGFTTLILVVLFLGGVQLGAVGLLGEYIGRIYKETKARPNFVVETLIRDGEEQPRDS